MQRVLPNGRHLQIITGDITKVAAEAIVNAANAELVGGSGVNGAILRAGGPTITHELSKIRAESGGCPTGSAVVTSGGRLPAKYVFHAVGPIYQDGEHGEAELLASCYRTCLRLAEERRLATISFPAISTGVYGYPIEQAARIALEVVLEHLMREASSLREVILVVFDYAAYRVYERVLLE
jgi:O-acetyl-ADP-ribose deacetylase (regulator of RNase III)